MKNSIIGVAGMRGHGKSTELRARLSTVENPLLIIDTLGEHGDWTERLSGSCGANVNRITSGDFSKSSILLSTDEEIQQTEFLYYCRAIYTAARKVGGNVTLAVEEIDWFCKPNWENEGLKLLVQYGRHGPVDLIWTARNVGSVSRKLTSETDLYVLFRVAEPGWLDSLAERLGEDVREKVASLQKFEFLVVDNGGQILEERRTRVNSNERPASSDV